jgi:hypothetical protein
MNVNERSPEIMGMDRGTFGIDVRTRALKRINVERVTAKPRIKTSSSDAFLYLPAYREKEPQTNIETITAANPNFRISIPNSGGKCPSNLSKEASHVAVSQEVLSRRICVNLFLVNMAFGTAVRPYSNQQS